MEVIDKLIAYVRKTAEGSLARAKETLKHIEDLEKERAADEEIKEGYQLDGVFFDRIIAHEHLVRTPYYDLAQRKSDGKVSQLIRIENSNQWMFMQEDDHPDHGVGYTKYNVEDIDKLFNLEQATLTIGIGMTGDGYKDYSGNELTRETPTIGEALARDMVRHYAKDLVDELQCAPNKVVFDEMVAFFYNVGKGALHKKGKVKYMNEFAPTSRFHHDAKRFEEFGDRKEDEGKRPTVDKEYTFYELINENRIYPLCRRITWWRRAGGKQNNGLIRRRDRTAHNMLLEYIDDNDRTFI